MDKPDGLHSLEGYEIFQLKSGEVVLQPKTKVIGDVRRTETNKNEHSDDNSESYDDIEQLSKALNAFQPRAAPTTDVDERKQKRDESALQRNVILLKGFSENELAPEHIIRPYKFAHRFRETEEITTKQKRPKRKESDQIKDALRDDLDRIPYRPHIRTRDMIVKHVEEQPKSIRERKFANTESVYIEQYERKPRIDQFTSREKTPPQIRHRERERNPILDPDEEDTPQSKTYYNKESEEQFAWRDLLYDPYKFSKHERKSYGMAPDDFGEREREREREREKERKKEREREPHTHRYQTETNKTPLSVDNQSYDGMKEAFESVERERKGVDNSEWLRVFAFNQDRNAQSTATRSKLKPKPKLFSDIEAERKLQKVKQRQRSKF